MPEKLRVFGAGGAETPSVNVPPLILLFPQATILQKGSNLMVTVRIQEVSELLKAVRPLAKCTPFANLIKLN